MNRDEADTLNWTLPISEQEITAVSTGRYFEAINRKRL